MAIEEAIWFPGWYCCDQPVAVDEVRDIDFFHTPPEWVQHGGRRVFYNSDWSEGSRHLFYTQRMLIRSIRHPVMGPVRAIETGGLDYVMTLTDGRVFRIDSEERCGCVSDWPEPSQDWDASKWHVVVEMEVCDLPKRIVTFEGGQHKS